LQHREAARRQLVDVGCILDLRNRKRTADDRGRYR